MIGPTTFAVLTEFRFDIGHAVANSKALQSAVGGISDAADSALMSFERLSAGLVAQIGLGTGSLLGVLGAAIQASDKFGASQRQLANIFLSNNMFKGADAFEQAMAQAASNMDVIRKKAQEFALPASEMASTTKLIGATLVSHGLDDSGLKHSMDIARGFLKSAPTLGIDPGLAQGQLLNTVLGRASMQDTLFTRLMNETQAMGKFKGSPQGFNALKDADRVKVLTSALLQFGSNAKILEGNAHSLSGEIQRLKDSFLGMFSILKPIGDVILNVILPTFRRVNDFFQKEGLILTKNIGKLLNGVLGDPEKMITNLLQMKRARDDLSRAGNVVMGWGMFIGFLEMLKFLGFNFTKLGFIGAVLSNTLSALSAAFSWFWSFVTRLLVFLTGASTVFGAFWKVLNGLTIVASRVLVPLALLFAFFQLISRAIAIAHVEDVKAVASEATRFSYELLKLKVAFENLLEPFAAMFDSIARGISPLFRMSNWFELLIWLTEKLGNVLIEAQAGFQGFIFAIIQMIKNIMDVFSGGGFNIFKGVGDAFQAGMDMMIEDIMKKVDSGDAIVNATTTVGAININNQFKEQMEPDRIAFTLMEQIKKATTNPGQAKNNSQAMAFAGGH